MRPPEDPGRQRGRPASPPGSSLGEYLRGLRLARNWTIRELARAIGLSETSAAYISQMEAGLKVPHHLLARKLAEQLGDPKGVFPLWAEIGGRKDPHRAAAARRELARILEDPSLMHDARFARPGTTRFERLQQSLLLEQTLSAEETPMADEASLPDPTTEARWVPMAAAQSLSQFAGDSLRLLRERAQQPFRKIEGGYRVPILPEGEDPDTARGPILAERVAPTEEFVRLGSEVLREKKLLHPFAYRMTETSIQRVGTVLKPGDVVIISQDQVPIVEHEIYAVRNAGTVELAHALWNGRQLLLLPDAGKSNFAVLEAEGEAALAKLMVGHMVTVIRAGSSQAGS